MTNPKSRADMVKKQRERERQIPKVVNCPKCAHAMHPVFFGDDLKRERCMNCNHMRTVGVEPKNG